MKRNFSSGLTTLAVLGCGLCFSTERASASVMGALDLDGGSVTVSATNLIWSGFAIVNGISTLTYGPSNTLVPGGTDVTLQNLPGSLPTPINDFMSFAGIPSLDFTLDMAGPGSSNTDCSAAGLFTHGGQCSAFNGVPLILSQATNGTLVALGVSGIVSDGTSPISTWTGEFSETITSLTISPGVVIISPTPLQIQQYFGGPGAPNSNTISSTYSGTFVATIQPTTTTPEPSSTSMVLMGSGLVLVALRRRRKHPPVQ
jgi:hypothetical protein